jgi:ankyrin repeat protein
MLTWIQTALKVNYQALAFQAWFLSLAPPTRALDTPFDPVMPRHPAVTWIHEQGPYKAFSKPGQGPRLLHLHADGNRLLDISEASRLFYLDYDAFSTQDASNKTMVYFEFEQHDSRYNTISSLLLYLLNSLAWHFWDARGRVMLRELEFLSHAHAWSLEDMFHLYSTLRGNFSATGRLTVFISCFDQCPLDQRQWFLKRVLEEQSHNDNEYRIVISTSAKDGLAVTCFPDEARINLDECPTLTSPSESLDEEIRLGLSALTTKRPIYEDFRPQLEKLFEQCGDVPYLRRIILTWLSIHHRGKPRSEIADKISKLSPPTAENVVRVFIISLAPALRTRAETVFNWIKNAAEPWSPESMTEALAVRELDGGEPSFEDLDVQGTMNEIEEAFGGIIVLKNGNVQFSHASFYDIPEVGFKESGLEATARANSTIAETCLRYFQLSCAQEALAELSLANLSPAEGGMWAMPLESTMISHPRTSMADYAIRFWHHHYNCSGKFRPRELVVDLFSSKEARAAWELPFWLFSNPFTRMQRTYISTLPVLAMLGLEDLVEEKVRNERGRPTFEKDCWYAITEAARAGRKEMVQQLLAQVTVDKEELQVALHWGAGRGDAGVVNVLLAKIPNLETFRWADINLMHQAAAAGLDDLLAAMLLSGCDVNETCDVYSGAPPTIIAVWRKRIPTLEFLLSSEYKPDLTTEHTTAGETPLMAAVDRGGHPRIIEVLVQGGASIEVDDEANLGFKLVQRAAREHNHRAMDVLIKAGADFKSGSDTFYGPPLSIVATSGSHECVRVLLAHGADPNTEFEGATVLHQAVGGNHTGVTRQLLTHDPKPDMDKTPPGQEKLLLRAIRTKNVELVSLLLDHGAEIDYFDPQAIGFAKTPLSVACALGCLEIAKLLLAKGADINYAGPEGLSDSPLIGALNDGEIEVARYLLQNETIDVKRAATDGTTPLHLACDADLISELLKKGTPIDGHSIHFGTTLHRAALRNKPQEIEVLLANDPKADVNYMYGEDAWDSSLAGLTPLQLACRFSALEAVKSLLDGGADSRLKNKNGDDAVDILIQTGSDSDDALECLRLLLSAPYSVPVDQVSNQGRTRLHGIKEKTPVSVVQLLVENDAPLDVQNQEGHSPLSVAVGVGNESVAKYLVKEGASVRRYGPSFGSILHLAVWRGDLDMTKFLLDSGADPEAADPEYGESLLYTALGITDDEQLKTMVRYLVDEAKVPINKHGGAMFSYPIIRAANLVRIHRTRSISLLKFLIRRKAQLDVTDSQGRRAVHVASAAFWDDGIRALVKAGADIDVEDAMGRKPIHFAATLDYGGSLSYLMATFKAMDINQADHDKWTPLMWAVSSGTLSDMSRYSNSDLWARGRGPDGTDEWSALKLMKFSGFDPWKQRDLFTEMERIKPDDKTVEYDDSDHHEVEVGDQKPANCASCFIVSYNAAPLPASLFFFCSAPST